MLEQPLFPPQPPTVSRERAGAADYPMTGQDDGYWVGPVGRTDGAAGFGTADGSGNITVRNGFCVGNGFQGFPDGDLKRGAQQFQRKLQNSSPVIGSTPTYLAA